MGSQCSSSNSSASDTAAWQLLAARAVHAAGELIDIAAQKQRRQPVCMQEPAAGMSNLPAQARLVVNSSSAAIEWLGLELPAIAASAASGVSSALALQQAALSRALPNLLQQHGGSDGSSSCRVDVYGVAGFSVNDETAARMMVACRTAIGDSLAEQLQEFGAAV
jgi:hypothetical protein